MQNVNNIGLMNMDYSKNVFENLKLNGQKSKQKYENNKKKIQEWKNELEQAFEEIITSDEESSKNEKSENSENQNENSNANQQQFSEQLEMENSEKKFNKKRSVFDLFQNEQNGINGHKKEEENDDLWKKLNFDRENIQKAFNIIKKEYEKIKKKYGNKKIEHLEYKMSKLQYLQMIRRQKMQSYVQNQEQQQKKQSQNNNNEKFLNIMNSQKYNSNSSNKKQIEKALLQICSILQGPNFQDPLESKIMKKHKLNNFCYFNKSSKNYGLKSSDFRKLSQYKVQIDKIPKMGGNFAEAEKTIIPQQHNIINSKNAEKFFQLIEFQASQQMSKKFQERFARPQAKNLRIEEFDAIRVEPISSPLKIKFQQDKQQFFDNYSDIQHLTLAQLDGENSVNSKLKSMDAEQYAQFISMQVAKQWKLVMKDFFKISRFATKSRQDVEQNCKKFANYCQKEVRKKYLKSQKIQKEHQFRAKRLYKEMTIYWRRKEKELQELKKRQEKLELELKKKEEEEQEAIKKKRSLEYLMRQAGMFSFIMAKKIGVDMNKPSSTQQEIQEATGVGEGREEALEGGEKEVIIKGKKVKIQIDEDKAANEVAGIISQNQQKMQDYDLEHSRKNEGSELAITADDLKNTNQLDFTQVDEQNYDKLIQQSHLLKGTLKQYQLKGLRWLDNLFTQGINGILADEMGLGKTIQAIALLGTICSERNIWGPFLIIAPASTLYNWQQELRKFLPQLKVLPYWGSQKQRKIIRKFFSAKNLGQQNSVFHVVITSYQLIVSDEKAFHRIKWQYMILDEAQAIKNINSIRWQILLTIKARNKLLLTGTPIQNSMAELWALLHFIMPDLFNSHEQFQEWFSKNIEDAAQKDKTQLNTHQLQRLHMILKPFMLRRVKKDVEHEIGKKHEIQVFCEMTRRQKRFYDTIKAKLSITDFFMMIENRQKVENLMNLVMQFRKVCNHPELFERRPNRSSYLFVKPYYSTNVSLKFGEIKPLITDQKSPIAFEMPKLVYNEIVNANNFKKITIEKKFDLWSAEAVKQGLLSAKGNCLYSFIRFMGFSLQFLEFVKNCDCLYLQVILMHYFKKMQEFQFSEFNPERKKNGHLFYINQEVFRPNGFFSQFQQNEYFQQMLGFNPKRYFKYIPEVIANPIELNCSSISSQRKQFLAKENKEGYKILYGENYKKFQVQLSDSKNYYKRGQTSVLIDHNVAFKQGYLTHDTQESMQKLEIVDFASLVADSAKLNYLDGLLYKLKREGHRVLIFCQMTKMLNILEDFMAKRQYLFFRLDGSTNISDRKDMVTEFQTNPKIFCFLLSTRAGGLGITLTAADVVIFYDNDWNPTMDQQATDRAHRIGQTKDVFVYRMITKGTIEERIVRRAQQKQDIQTTVYGGGQLKTDTIRPQEVLELLFDEQDMNVNEKQRLQEMSSVINKKKQGKKQLFNDMEKGKKGPKKKEKGEKQPGQKKGKKQGRKKKNGKKQQDDDGERDEDENQDESQQNNQDDDDGYNIQLKLDDDDDEDDDEN
ncbi:P-loop containing nucleoside triphosphate hydrolase [Pseudocohnilembus persalinus]|uniref:Chromatin-remodeling ATPase INO80 n=1 Tax=Pseudocohnilembus persalinus TaxID=266149 RepID=A0A0V0R2W9_PSEPJ|nr:P-loop containing nucleoside triphosphate hydrolase [Pseudocohnilembus persalinus]|eukprot:KRX08854.1 P-loop containing nucleoside triphosphate hydrolase [Pseudocohnilembus persalinus]